MGKIRPKKMGDYTIDIRLRIYLLYNFKKLIKPKPIYYEKSILPKAFFIRENDRKLFQEFVCLI